MISRRARSGERYDRAGFTLLEMVVALALLGLILGVSAVAVASLREPPETAINRLLIAARDSAIHSGKPVTVTVTVPDTVEYHAPRTTHALFLPDGSAVGAGVARLTGTPHGNP